ncbi:MAG: transglutaminase domain-containing protein [candidate division KSB1 bacterium]|nr:transglutaminase domain-containing protein [candidate division KSB1 bacterium]MDZ7303057.1 transglutaminase domain-containing protein [candidate division KSB1 bacterium]MDZ7312435.1 transglutaminase domain-containing protein [candidate division KSB1 bacterium]
MRNFSPLRLPAGVALLLMLFAATPVILRGENYLLRGTQTSRINYSLTQRVIPIPGTRSLIISTVVPSSFQSPTYNQEIENLTINFLPTPSKREEKIDKRGNKVIVVTWTNPTGTITASVSLSAKNYVLLNPLSTAMPFPLEGVEPAVKDYLLATAQVPADDPRIRAKAAELTRGVKTEFDAVQRILSWVIDHTTYVLTPPKYDAMYTFETGKGNCQNYSHLAAALMRAVGIPVRIVNGVTLKRSYDAKTEYGKLTFGMAQGRHSWIDVYFPDLGWVPFDPQQSQLFTSNRYIRIEAGLDNNETSQDGLIRWIAMQGATGQPEFEEIIDSDFPEDQVNITASRQKYGPKSILLSPEVRATFEPYLAAATPAPPPPSPATTPAPGRVTTAEATKKVDYNKPFVFGNLDFPEAVNFAFARDVAAGTGGAQELRKNFLVETAEYVTRSAQYAQIVVLNKAVQLQKVGLALQKFGGEGYLWVELLKDEKAASGQMVPGERIANSGLISLNEMSSNPGYRWVDFDFSKTAPKLPPGRYWLALGFSGTPVVNWFYSYGKPVGPSDGTRYKTILDQDWSNSLSYEFNYRVVGLTTE